MRPKLSLKVKILEKFCNLWKWIEEPKVLDLLDWRQQVLVSDQPQCLKILRWVEWKELFLPLQGERREE